MKKLLAVTGVILIAYVLFSASYGGQNRSVNSARTDSGNGSVYVMREEDDRVVVYLNDALYLRTDTRVSSLPKSDRLKLKNGIPVYSKEELKILVEDYCS